MLAQRLSELIDSSQMIAGSACLTCPNVRSGDSELETFINRFMLVEIFSPEDLNPH